MDYKAHYKAHYKAYYKAHYKAHYKTHSLNNFNVGLINMEQKIIDKISYEYYSNDKDNFFQDHIVPSIIYKIFMNIPNDISSDSVQRCQENINQLNRIIKKMVILTMLLKMY